MLFGGKDTWRSSRQKLFLGAFLLIGFANLLIILSLLDQRREALTPPPLVNAMLSCSELYEVVVWSEEKHLGNQELKIYEEAFAKKVATKIVEKLDPHKLFLTKKEVSAFVKSSPKAWKRFLENQECNLYNQWITVEFPKAQNRFLKQPCILGGFFVYSNVFGVFQTDILAVWIVFPFISTVFNACICLILQ